MTMKLIGGFLHSEPMSARRLEPRFGGVELFDA
jgi:hypothetical protein